MSTEAPADPLTAAPPYVLAAKPAAAQSYRGRYRVRTSDVDESMRLRLDGVARLVQNVSEDMIADSSFFDSDPFWVLRRTIIDVIDPVSWPGTVEVQRWCTATSTRWVNMRQSLHATHEQSPFNRRHRLPGHIETESFCIKIDASAQLSRISDAALEALGRHAHDTRLRWIALNTEPLPRTNGTDTQFQPRASDIDPFGHVNNTIYWQVVEDELTTHPALTSAPHRAVVEFLKPIEPGTQLGIRTRHTDDRLAIWLLLDDNIVAATATVRPLTV
ncbi:acyl-ACP thioesterase domain-containing protein [Nocardia sp. NPDC050710]|uniref:acyl-ACP thioesterase domain-containing protein n=1 Tax=Nocardia sp. NPDC050710 TaxID=3157220 RepID=UPI0033F47F53